MPVCIVLELGDLRSLKFNLLIKSIKLYNLHKYFINNSTKIYKQLKLNKNIEINKKWLKFNIYRVTFKIDSYKLNKNIEK